MPKVQKCCRILLALCIVISVYPNFLPTPKECINNVINDAYKRKFKKGCEKYRGVRNGIKEKGLVIDQ